MSLYKCIIIDDEPQCIENLEKYITSIPNLVPVKKYTDPALALIELSSGEHVDLIFMDIDMPGINGIELSRELRKKTRVLVITTAHTKYAFDAFEIAADAYLLKPYTLFKFAATIAKLLPRESAPENEIGSGDDFFFVKNKYDNLKLVKIRFREVIAVESRQNYVLIHTLSQKILTYMSLTEIAQILNQFNNFLRFQRSFIIGKEHIDSIEGNTIRMSNGIQVTVGDNYRKDFTEFVSKKLIKAGRKT